MSLTAEPRPGVDPLANLPRPGVAAGGYMRRNDDTPSPARVIVIEFLKARLAANNARLTFLLDPSPENMTAWADAENKALGDQQ